MKKKTFLFIAFGCLGITTEIFFTGVTDAVSNYFSKGYFDYNLIGKSYIWMFLIYGATIFIFPPIYNFLKKYPLLLRIFVYAIIIFCIEFTAGFLLDVIIGSCPWYYTSKFAVMGYIRLDYIFFWMGFGFVIEKVYLFLTRMTEYGIILKKDKT